MRPLAGVAAGMAIVVVALGLVLSQRDRRLAASNSRVAASGVEVPVRPGAQWCQAHEHVPKSAPSVRVFVHPSGGRGGPFDVSIRAEGAEVARGEARPGFTRGGLVVPLTVVNRDLADATVCIRNRSAGLLAFAGNLTALETLARIGHPQGNAGATGDVIRLDFLRRGRESWWDLAPRIADRLYLFKGPFRGPGVVWVIVLLVGLAAGTAIALLLRMPRDG